MSKIKKLNLYLRTIKHLTSRQIFYQLFYRAKKIAYANFLINEPSFIPATTALKFVSPIPSRKSYHNNAFTFLNKEKVFDGEVNWNYGDLGKLWAYNLNYFDFLLQQAVTQKDAVRLLDSYCAQPLNRAQGTEPYPISIRGVNWIKYFSLNNLNEARYNAILYNDYNRLAANLEYHLMGNHLLENGFSLLFASFFFNNDKFYVKAERILNDQLREQILEDGAHFELSPMYHQILLSRLLDCINLLQHNEHSKNNLLSHLQDVASKMLGWLKNITFSNGDIPMANDSSVDIAPSSEELFNYAHSLGIKFEATALDDSGYRMIDLGELEMFIDVGNIGPDYIPGHAHSDTFNFVLYFNGKPIIVDSGTSTYETSTTRTNERSTRSHNTVMINNQDQSEVWGSFRVGRRAKIIERRESQISISVSHDGYKKLLGLIHNREWQWDKNQILITDKITGKNSGALNSIAFIHFHPDLYVKIENEIIFAGPLQIDCKNHTRIQLNEYDFATGFNTTRKAVVVEIQFNNQLTTFIKL